MGKQPSRGSFNKKHSEYRLRPHLDGHNYYVYRVLHRLPSTSYISLLQVNFTSSLQTSTAFRLGKDSGGRLSPEERIYHALATIGYPLIQCGLSTILFVTCLLFVDTYMSEVL